MGKVRTDPTSLELEVRCDREDQLASLTNLLVDQGCYEKSVTEALLLPASKDSCVPENFYATTSRRTQVFLHGAWQDVAEIRMDGAIVARKEGLSCRLIREVKATDSIVCSSLYGISLGIALSTEKPVYEGHRNHIRAINTVFNYGSVRAAVEAGAVAQGVMFACVKAKVPYVLAGSLRDDGPLPETEMDMLRAQKAYMAMARRAALVIMLSTMLHSIAMGNMIPAWVKTIYVDINPAVVTKLSDRGSGQTIGIATDVGLFLRTLAEKLQR
jgi:hypothetical protein